MWLGGDDVDSRLVNLIKQKVVTAEGLADIDALIAKIPHYQRVRFLQDLKLAAERAKIDLSNAISIDVMVTRKEFEVLISPLIDRTLEICQDAIKYSDYPQDTIDMVLLVGGSSQIPQ